MAWERSRVGALGDLRGFDAVVLASGAGIRFVDAMKHLCKTRLVEAAFWSRTGPVVNLYWPLRRAWIIHTAASQRMHASMGPRSHTYLSSLPRFRLLTSNSSLHLLLRRLSHVGCSAFPELKSRVSVEFVKGRTLVLDAEGLNLDKVRHDNRRRHLLICDAAIYIRSKWIHDTWSRTTFACF